MEHPFYALIDDGRFAKEEKSVEVKESPKPQTNESTTTQESTRTTTTSDAEKPAPSRLLPNEVDYVIYHSPCSDGTTSGLIAWKYLQANFPDREVTYKGMSPGSRPPEGLEGAWLIEFFCSHSRQECTHLRSVVPQGAHPESLGHSQQAPHFGSPQVRRKRLARFT